MDSDTKFDTALKISLPIVAGGQNGIGSYADRFILLIHKLIKERIYPEIGYINDIIVGIFSNM